VVKACLSHKTDYLEVTNHICINEWYLDMFFLTLRLMCQGHCLNFVSSLETSKLAFPFGPQSMQIPEWFNWGVSIPRGFGPDFVVHKCIVDSAIFLW